MGRGIGCSMSGTMKNGSPRESKNGSPASSSVSPDFWNEHDREAVSGLVAMVRRVEQHAFEIGDRGLIADAHSLLSGLVQLYDLLRAFRNSPDGRIKGPQGVAKKLGLTRNGVYCRLEMVGLDPEDLRDPSAEVMELLSRSRILGPLANRLQDTAGLI